ncbi:MAG: hypothetical protein EOP38_16730 [Rubrivivax sp.]|nr:MAG: hypothetical protein EOP38_16730 [Rubrivivax sp.]
MSGTQPGLVSGLRGLAATLIRSLKTRVELAQVELEQERHHLIRHLALLLLTVFFTAFGAFLAVIWLMLVLPEEWRTLLAGGAALLFFLVAGAGLTGLLRGRNERPALLGGFLEVLQGDVDALSGTGPATAGLGSRAPSVTPGGVMPKEGLRP